LTEKSVKKECFFFKFHSCERKLTINRTRADSVFRYLCKHKFPLCLWFTERRMRSESFTQIYTLLFRANFHVSFTHRNSREKKEYTTREKRDTINTTQEAHFSPRGRGGDTSANKTVALYIKRGHTRGRRNRRESTWAYISFSRRGGHVALGHTPPTISRLNYSVRCTVCPSAVFIKREPESAAGELILASCLL